MLRIVLSIFLAVLYASPLPAAGKRVALIIGNSAYLHTPELTNPKNDAADMAAALQSHDFEVITGSDLDKAGMDRTIRDFSAALTGADAAVFFYAGHGLQVGGVNYLVPVDAQLTTAAALDWEMVRLDLVQRTMEREASTNILFLDACRDNPLSRNLARALGTRSVDIGRGLAAAESGVGTLISFSTQPGNVALDGTGRNSPFAAALVKSITSSADAITDLLVSVRNDVMQATNRRQVPWEHSALTGRFYFKPPSATPPAIAAGPDTSAAERAWPLVQDSDSIAALEGFRKQFGAANPFYDSLAANRIAALNQQRAKASDDEAGVQGQVHKHSVTIGQNPATSTERPWLDLAIQNVTVPAPFGRSDSSGALVTEATAGGPGAAGGVLQGDIILELDGRSISNARDLAHQIALRKPGASVEVTVWRNGRGPQDLVRRVRSRADAGDAPAMVVMADLYERGIGVHKDETEAVRWNRKAAEAGHPMGMHQLAYRLEQGQGIAKDQGEAAQWYRKAAEAGHLPAMYNFAVALDKGEGVAEDDADAVRWYRKAAEAGSPSAMYNLGVQLDEGEGTPKDEIEAARWLFRSIEKGHQFAIDKMSNNATQWSLDARKELQRLLKQEGLYSGPIDGAFGPKAVDAVKSLARRAEDK